MGWRGLSGLASDLGLSAFTLGFRVQDFECGVESLGACVDEPPLRVQVPNNHILTQKPVL